MFKTLLEVENISDYGGTWEKQLRESIWQQYEDGLERNKWGGRGHWETIKLNQVGGVEDLDI